MDITTPEKLAEIRRLNTQFRNTFRGGKVVLTHSFAELPSADTAAILQTVADFKDFNEENDPHEERDFGSFNLSGREVWWKIDYYNLSLDGLSEDPGDPDKTKRVMTVGLSMDF